MTVQRFRSTDYQARPQPLRVCTTPEEARQAALTSVSSHCLDCGTTFVGNSIPNHKCHDATGRDLVPMKKARAEGAIRELKALRNFSPAPPCQNCGAEMPSGQWHECESVNEPLPHEVAAAKFQRRGMAVLDADLKEAP